MKTTKVSPGEKVIISDGVILKHETSGKEYLVKDSSKGTGFIFVGLNKIETYRQTISNYIEFVM